MKIAAICPIGNRVVIQRERESDDQHWSLDDEGTVSILVMPLSARRADAQSIGRVIAVGPDVKTVRVGDKVVFAAVAGFEFLGSARLIMHEADVLAVLQGV